MKFLETAVGDFINISNIDTISSITTQQLGISQQYVFYIYFKDNKSSIIKKDKEELIEFRHDLITFLATKMSIFASENIFKLNTK